MPLPVLSLLRSTATAGSVLMLFVSTVSSQPFVIGPQLRGTTAVSTKTSLLKHLPAGHDELVFHGENASRIWSIYLSGAEADRASSFQLAMINTVTVLPERSWLRLTVNGHVLSILPMQSPDKVTPFLVKIPKGVLVPGANQVQISIALTHRVDCSVKATYELWTRLDPAQTGIVVDPNGSAPLHAIEDLAAEPLAEDGTTRIHLRTPDGTDPVSLGRAGRVIDALVRRAHLYRPVVDVGPEVGRGSGFDVIVMKGASPGAVTGGLRLLGRADNVTMQRDPATNRLSLVLSGMDDADLDWQVAELDKRAASSVNPLTSTTGVVIDAGTRKNFSELGFSTDDFAGRHYMSSVGITLPSDFYAANYDKARLLIDGAHSATLAPNSELIFRVNDAIVSTMQLAAGKPEQFEHAIAELPLRFFHPGHNELTIEGIINSPSDQQCDLTITPRETRLTISATSELEFPHFAHLETLPQIPAALANSAVPEQGGPPHMYLPDDGRASVGTALTLLANMASTLERTEMPVLHLTMPGHGDVPGIVIAPFDRLSDTLTTSLHKIMRPVAQAGTEAALDTTTKPLGPGVGPGSTGTVVAANPSPFNPRFGAALATGQALLRNHGFFFSGTDSEADTLPFGAHSLLIGAVSATATAPTAVGIDLPQFTRDPTSWLVVTAQRPDIYEKGIVQLVANGQWTDLAGQAVSLDLDTNFLRSAQPVNVTYVIPNQFVLSDVRPIMGGIISNNILLVLGALMLLMTILGGSTYTLIRRMGAK